MEHRRRAIVPSKPVRSWIPPRPVMHETYSVEPSRMMERPRGVMDATPGYLPMGDYAQTGEPHQAYWRILQRGGMVMPPQKPVIQPPVDFPADTAQKLQYLARAIGEVMGCTTMQSKAPNWTEPPSESIMIDQSSTADGIAIPATGVFTEVLRVIAPDRFYLVLNQFGNALEDDVAFTNVDWRILININPAGFSQYLGAGAVAVGIFNAQLGNPANPTRLSMPIITKYGDVVSVQARSVNAMAHTAYARIMGWAYPVQTIDGSGSACGQTGQTGVIPIWTYGQRGATAGGGVS